MTGRRPADHNIATQCRNGNCPNASLIRQVRKLLNRERKWLTAKEIYKLLDCRNKGTLQGMYQYLRFWSAQGLIEKDIIEGMSGYSKYPVAVYYWRRTVRNHEKVPSS